MPAFDQVELQTSRLLLRPLRDTDASELFDIFSDPQVMRYWSTPPWTSIDDAQALLARDRKALPEGEYIRLAMRHLDTGRVIGTCSLFDLSEQCRRAEIGYGLSAQVWGQGYMHEALSALLGFGFSALDLNRVEADIDPRNLASARSLERQGFVREGFLRERWIVGGVVSDTAFYGLLRGDWQRNVGKEAGPSLMRHQG